MNNWGIRNEFVTNYKSVCYIAKRLKPTLDEWGNQIPTYDTPIKYYFNIQPVTNTSNGTPFGELTPRLRCAVISKVEYDGLFHEYDLAYLEGLTPDNESFNGEKANYRIYSIQPQNAILKVYFLKIINETEEMSNEND